MKRVMYTVLELFSLRQLQGGTQLTMVDLQMRYQFWPFPKHGKSFFSFFIIIDQKLIVYTLYLHLKLLFLEDFTILTLPSICKRNALTEEWQTVGKPCRLAEDDGGKPAIRRSGGPHH